MEGIKLWIASLSAVTLIMSVISSLAPKNSAGRVCSMLGSVMLIVVLISPIKKITSSDIFEMSRAYEDEINKSIETSAEKFEEIENEIIGEKLSAYVLNKAKANACEVSVKLDGDMPVSATVISKSAEEAGRVCAVLEEEFGISPEKQEVKIEGK